MTLAITNPAALMLIPLAECSEVGFRRTLNQRAVDSTPTRPTTFAGLKTTHKNFFVRGRLVVMDITMKKMDGITAARLIKAQYPNTLIVGCSAHTQEYNVYVMKRVCAYEVLLKKEDAVEHLYQAIERITTADLRTPLAQPLYLQGASRHTLAQRAILRIWFVRRG